jgi:hypothetical protein
MERAGYLINKLKEQYYQQESPTHLLITLDLLRKELFSQLSPDSEEINELTEASPAPITITSRPSDDALYALDFAKDIPTFAHQDFPCKSDPVSKEGRKTTPNLSGIANTGAEKNQQHTDSTEYDSNEPIRDLKRSINAKDRFMFINELFRGDEVMYERSMKTIQGFSIFPEARFWIERELKTKLGWHENHPTVQYFDHLIKRRFS